MEKATEGVVEANETVKTSNVPSSKWLHSPKLQDKQQEDSIEPLTFSAEVASSMKENTRNQQQSQ